MQAGNSSAISVRGNRGPRIPHIFYAADILPSVCLSHIRPYVSQPFQLFPLMDGCMDGISLTSKHGKGIGDIYLSLSPFRYRRNPLLSAFLPTSFCSILLFYSNLLHFVLFVFQSALFRSFCRY